MTAEQKEANKAARRERDRAHTARCKEREEAEKRGQQEIAASGVLDRINAAGDALNILMERWNAELAEIDRQIAALQSKKVEVNKSYEPQIAANRYERDEAYDAKRAAENALRKRLDEEFPDLCGHALWSAAAWGDRRQKS